MLGEEAQQQRKSRNRAFASVTILALSASVWLIADLMLDVTRYKYVGKQSYGNGDVSVFIINEARGEVCRIDMAANEKNAATVKCR